MKHKWSVILSIVVLTLTVICATLDYLAASTPRQERPDAVPTYQQHSPRLQPSVRKEVRFGEHQGEEESERQEIVMRA